MKKFSELKLDAKLLQSLAEMGFVEMTPIQADTFEPIMAGRDIIARAETGSGKTAACGIPMISMVDHTNKEVQGLILVPTRELALQYVQAITALGERTDVKAFAVYGGFSMAIQLSKLHDGVQILVATPGRLIDLLYNSSLSLGNVSMFVLDEADEMLNMGFIDDVNFIASCLVHEHQTLMFSATMPKDIKILAERHLKDPLMVELNTKQIAPQNLTHYFETVSRDTHFDTLVKYLKEEKPAQAIIFSNSRTGSERLYKYLKDIFKSVDIIHGGMEQSRRTSLFNRFRKKDIRFIVATDVAGRGLDFSHVSHVINYELPKNQENYTHRTGRTARMGREGQAITFINKSELSKLKRLIRVANIVPNWWRNDIDLDNVSHSSGKTGSYGKYRKGGRSGSKGPNIRQSSGNSENRPAKKKKTSQPQGESNVNPPSKPKPRPRRKPKPKPE
ncbi:MAG: DEAD/DEAH box helicase [Phycisphaerae bacterium]|nr:DEAD/DEAH box helicase [Phycisphaerae bacterium]